MRILRIAGICILALSLFAGSVAAQQMQGMHPSMKMPMKEQQPCSPKPMSMMGMGEVPNPDLLITTFEKQVVLPDEALGFSPTGMGEKFFAKLIAKVDVGNDVWFSIRKARIPKGGNVGIMRMTEICYIEKGLGLLIDEQGGPPKGRSVTRQLA